MFTVMKQNHYMDVFVKTKKDHMKHHLFPLRFPDGLMISTKNIHACSAYPFLPPITSERELFAPTDSDVHARVHSRRVGSPALRHGGWGGWGGCRWLTRVGHGVAWVYPIVFQDHKKSLVDLGS